MEKMQYAEELVREFLVFRGFTNTLEAYETELRSDIGKGFQVDKILDLIFSVYIPKFQADKLISLLAFFKHYISETTLVSTFSKLEASLLRFYVVHALQSNRTDKVVEFFKLNGAELLQSSHDWTNWFGAFFFFCCSCFCSFLMYCFAAIPYTKNPHLDPEFRIFFSKEWYQALHLSARNFFSELFNATRLPALLKISTEMNASNLLKRDIIHLNLKLSQLQALLDEKESQLRQYRSTEGSLSSSSNSREESTHMSKDYLEVLPTVISRVGQAEISQDSVVDGSRNIHSEITNFNSGDDSTSRKAGNITLTENDEVHREEDFAEVKVEHQETFLGHTSPISRCRFSTSGNNIASASLDGTVRIWTYDASTPVSRNATIYCGTEILSLDWECKSDRLLLIGTADGCIKAWNVEAKRVVCDLSTTEAFPRVSSNYFDNLGFASLTVWNMKTWKAMSFLLEKIHQQLLLFALITTGRF